MLDRIKSGIATGLIFACLYSLYVGGLYIVRGSEPFERLGTNVLTVIATYVIGGVSAGTVVGILRPLGKRRSGAILIAIVAAFFVFLGIAIAADGPPNHWGKDNWIGLIVLPILFGAVLGNSFWMKPVP